MIFHKKPSFLIRKRWPPISINCIAVILLFAACSNVQSIRFDNEDEKYINQLLEKASQKSDTGKIDAGLHYLDSAIAERKLNVREKFKVLSFKCGYYYRLKDSENAMLYADSMMCLVAKNDPEKFQKEYSLANYSKGDILLLMNKSTEAYTHYYKARFIGRNSLDSCTLGEYSYRIAMLLFQQKRFTEAAENFKQAYIETNKCDDDFVNYFRRQELLNNTGLSFQKAGMDDSALVYFNKALTYITKHDGKFVNKLFFNDIAKGVVYHGQGETFVHKGYYKQAENVLKKSIEINSKKGYDDGDAQLTMLVLANLYYKTNNIDGLNFWLKQARQSMDSIKNVAAEMEWNRLMWKYYETTSFVNKSYQYLKAFTLLQDSVQKSGSLNSSNVSEQIKIIDSENEIKNLQNENQVKNLYILLFIVVTTLAAVIILFSLFILRNTRKNIKQLEGLNKQIEQQKSTLEKTLSQLEEKNKEKDKILKVVAHDLRSPLASVSMVTEMILDEKCEGSREEMIKLIKVSADNSLNLINEILEAAGMENNTKSSKGKTNVNNLLKNSVELLRFKAAEKQQKLILFPSETNKDILINKEKIARVLNNLITNAIKFSGIGSSIEVKAIQKDTSLQIVVQDYGIGIPENLKNKVFNMFTEAKRMGTSGERPFGLGLSICKQIVEAHEGSIWFESEPGKGTAFFVELKGV